MPSMTSAELAELSPEYVRRIAPYVPGKPIEEPVAAARAADIVVRSGAFTVVVIPTLPSGRAKTKLIGLSVHGNEFVG